MPTQTDKTVLITGFEPYGGRSINPSSEIVAQLAEQQLDQHTIIGHVLPVTFNTVQQHIDQLLSDYNPTLILSLGLYPGSPTLRLERIAINVADCELPDNDGALYRDQPLAAQGPAALLATLPLRAIEQQLLAAGIPAEITNSAGTYLCNAVLYRFLYALQSLGRADIPCGFIHLPYLPAQVAELLTAEQQGTPITDALASMALSLQVAAIKRAITACLSTQST